MSKSKEYKTKTQESEFPVFPCLQGKIHHKTPGLYDFKIRGFWETAFGTPIF